MKRKTPLSRIVQLATVILPIVLASAAIAQTSAPLAAPEPSIGGLAAPEPGVGGTPVLSDPSTINSSPSTPSITALQPVIDGLAGKYGWLTTVLLAIGSLRILFKPIMLVVENALKNDPAKFAAVQRFEAGPVYRAIAMVLDVGASIKLPLVKPGPIRHHR